ncbi:hypothetical protein [uncultured Variovorax sp.]|jgi:hypothetical protein|uniref:hypothetical protein n=1 Tax=uncultured Variovorax sp. TaxID=114708 RepID=UPI00262ADB34|nr:hypothetical protein [uncultured Variovorax sp.]
MTKTGYSIASVRTSRAWADAGRLAVNALWWMAFALIQLLRVLASAVLVLAEPFVRAVLVPVALLGFFVTLVFGFLIGDANFPRWGMLAFSVGALVLYWLYLGLMSLFMSLPSHDSHHR